MTSKDAAYQPSGTAASLGAPVAHEQQLQAQPINPPKMTSKGAAYPRSGTAASLGAPVAHEQQLQVQPIIGKE